MVNSEKELQEKQKEKKEEENKAKEEKSSPPKGYEPLTKEKDHDGSRVLKVEGTGFPNNYKVEKANDNLSQM